jgi:hypothetical protein
MLGLIDSIVATALGAEPAFLLSFVFIILVLLFKPTGLFGYAVRVDEALTRLVIVVALALALWVPRLAAPTTFTSSRSSSRTSSSRRACGRRSRAGS